VHYGEIKGELWATSVPGRAAESSCYLSNKGGKVGWMGRRRGRSLAFPVLCGAKARNKVGRIERGKIINNHDIQRWAVGAILEGIIYAIGRE